MAVLCREIWMSVGVAEDHILPGNAKDNFWGECLWNGYRMIMAQFPILYRDGSRWPLWTVQ